MPAKSVEVPRLRFEPYTFDGLRKLLCEFGCTPELKREEKLHLVYFEEYFNYFCEKGPVTVVVEPQYYSHIE